MKFKNLFKSLAKDKGVDSDYFYGVGGLVYRTRSGRLEVLLSCQNNGWDIPKFRLTPTDQPERVLMTELMGLSAGANFKIIQVLDSPDSFAIQESESVAGLHLFLVQAWGGYLSPLATQPKTFKWVNFKDALKTIVAPDLKHRLHLVSQQIKKAQI